MSGFPSSLKSATPRESLHAEAEVSSSADSKTALLEVDTSAAPDGANVDQLVSIDEVRTIIGMEDVFIAVPAG